MNKNRVLCASLLAMLLASPGVAEDHYLLRLRNASSIGQVCHDHGVNLVKTLTGSGNGLFVVSVPAGPSSSAAAHSLATDPSVSSVENDFQVALPETAGGPVRSQSNLPVLFNPSQNSPYYGSVAWGPYVNQPAVWIMGVSVSHWAATGNGVVVALIDTGVDTNNLVLQPFLVPGYDFTRNTSGGSEMVDVNQSTTEVLDQSTTEVLDYASAVILTLNQSTTEVLDQSTTEVLDQSTTEAAGFDSAARRFRQRVPR